MGKARIRGVTYAHTIGASDPVRSLGDAKGIPVGHIVYLVNVLNTSTTTSISVGSGKTEDYTLAAGAAKDFYFVDPALITFAAGTGTAVTTNIDVSGEFPGACPICDGD